MKNIVFVVFIAALLSSNLTAQEVSTQPAFFRLLITGIGEIEGEVRIAMFDSKKAYSEQENPVHAQALPVKDHTISWSPPSSQEGEYAIAVYHDKNKNGKLDMNILGIPKEPYGFSNNARGKFGPASWEDAVFKMYAGTNTMEIEIR